MCWAIYITKHYFQELTLPLFQSKPIATGPALADGDNCDM